MTILSYENEDKAQEVGDSQTLSINPVEQYPTYTNHNGYLMPKGFPIDGFESGIRYQAQERDLIVTTYPKCGTTWTQNIVYLILNNGDPLEADVKLESVFPHLEEVGSEAVERLSYFGLSGSQYRLIKTHLPYNMTPQNPKTKYIYIVRNPKDCALSFYHHTRGFPKHYNFAEGRLELFLDLFLEGQVDFGNYFECVPGWYAHRNDDNMLFLTYENMKADHRAAVLRIAAFLGPEYESHLIANDGYILEKVLHHSSFSSMNKDQLRWCSQRPDGHTNFVRKGVVGDWKGIFSPEYSKRFDEKIQKHFSCAELEDIWGPEYKELMFD